MVDQLEFGLELKKYRFKKQFCARRSIEAVSTVDLSPGIFQGKKACPLFVTTPSSQITKKWGLIIYLIQITLTESTNDTQLHVLQFSLHFYGIVYLLM